jgi:hypothetical protein
MADQPSGTQFRFLLHNRVQEHIGVQATLHQRRDFAGTRRHRRLQRRVLGTLGGHHPALGDVQVRMIRDPPNFGLGAVENGKDQSGIGGFDRADQCILAARMHNTGQHRFESPTALDQPFESMLRNLSLLPFCRRQNFQARGRDDPSRRVRALTVQHDDPLVRPFLPHHEPRRHRRGDRQRTLDLHGDQAD